MRLLFIGQSALFLVLFSQITTLFAINDTTNSTVIRLKSSGSPTTSFAHPLIATTVLNKTTGEIMIIEDGYDFVFEVSNAEFAQIQASCQIYESSAYLRWVTEATTWVVQEGLGVAREESLELVEGLDRALFNETGQELLAGNYVNAGLALLLARVKLPGLSSFDDLLAIAKKMKVTKGGKAQFEIIEISMREIFQELRKNGFKIFKINNNRAITLKNIKTDEQIFIRKSKSGGHKTFDTISKKVDNVQTDIRIPKRR